ncbi:hypothetical protein BH11PSE11_BH11PSE11_23740 [soil metagenome]
MTRYAIYYAPAAQSTLWQTGSDWLGRDALSGESFRLQAITGIPDGMLTNLTADVRRYGLHATLKPPFRLADGFTESHLTAMAKAFCASQRPVELKTLAVRKFGEFLALRPEQDVDDLNALAMRCVTYFERLRAPLTAAELAKRRRGGLSDRQEALLQRWGYPYTEEEFRFHLSLTDSLGGIDDQGIRALHAAAEKHFESALRGAPIVLDALTIFQEERAGEPFMVWKRFPFGGQPVATESSALGRLFYCVGPSGVGKDSLLRWVKERIPAHLDLVFARRTITRPAHASEAHEEVDAAGFRQLAADGKFAMQWQANNLCYGIRRDIETELLAGRDVIVNGSREYVPQLLQKFPAAQVIWVEAEAALIRERLLARNRETGTALQRRIARSTAFTPPEACNVIRIDNSDSVEAAGRRLMSVLAAKRQG